MRLKPHDRVLILGITGSGKTYFARKRIVAKAARVVVWDPHREYETQQRVSLDDLLERPEMLDAESLSISVTPDWKTPKDLAAEFEVFADLLSTAEGVTAVIDEVGLLKHSADSVEFVACQSRHWGVPVVFVAQRAVQVTKTAREQVSKIVSFRQSSPEDVDALIERCGEQAIKVRTLPRRQAWYWSEAEAWSEDGPETEPKQKVEEEEEDARN